MNEEIWKDIQNYSGYQVSSQGRVRSIWGKQGQLNPEGTWRLKSPVYLRCRKHTYLRVALTKNKKTDNFLIHRLMYETFISSVPEGYVVDHIDRDTLNNSLENLRACTVTQNSINRRVYTRCIHKGVRQDKRRKEPTFYAQIQVKGKKLYLGTFSSAEEAAKAYDKAAVEYFGEYASLNNLEELN